jgi:Mrp family chromosome partitioning ATPase
VTERISRGGGGKIESEAEISSDRNSPATSPGSTPRSRVIAVVNQKGGVGKTTSAVNLAACFAVSERSTLLIDLDPQGNASSAYGITNPERHIYDALIGEKVIKDVVVSTQLEHLQVVPSGSDLVGAEIELVTRDDRFANWLHRFRRRLKRLVVRGGIGAPRWLVETAANRGEDCNTPND